MALETDTTSSARASSPGDSWRTFLPRGRTLDPEMWRVRHRGVIVLLWAHAVAVPIYGLIRGFSPTHVIFESGLLAAAALFASWPTIESRARTAVASIGLLAASSILVHFSGGLIEMHFHFFVMVTVVALYHDWIPFLAAIAYVLVHHGVAGAIDPMSVYNHQAAWNSPWKWAAIHALFIAGISAVCLVTWRLHEVTLQQRRRAEARAREESRVVTTLNEVGQALAAELEPEKVVQKVTDAATELTGAAFGAFFYNVVGDDGESYLLYTLSGAPIEAFSRFGLPRNTPMFHPTFTGEGVVRVDDVKADPRYGKVPPHYGMPKGHLPVCSYLAVPVVSRSGEVMGGLFFGHPEPARFTDVHERIVVGIASHAAVTLDNANLYESERRSRVAAESATSRLALLSEASRILASSLDTDAVLRSLAELVVPQIADACTVDLIADDGSFVRAAEVGQVPPGEQCAVVPLPGRESAVGRLSACMKAGSARTLSADDRTLLEELGRRAAAAVENARLYSRQRTVAETLQHSLLPERLPVVPGIEMEARYIPGGPDVGVGGDWYDVIQLCGGGVAVALGDVVGRGIRAASMMGQARTALRAYCLEGRRPSDALEALNRYVDQELGDHNMATVVCGVLDTESGIFRFANAGHPPPLVLSADGRVRFVEEQSGIPVGGLAYGRYAESEIALEPGDTLLLYTDGLIEDRRTTLDDGLRRLKAAASEAPGELGSLCDHVMAGALAGGSPTDDIALLAVRFLSLREHVSFTLPAQPAVLAPLRSALRRWLRSAGAAEDEVEEILVAVGEACSNAIVHPLGPKPTTFIIEGELDGGVRLAIRDEGVWRVQSVGDGGRGIEIMRTFMDHVDFRRHAQGTEVTLHRALASQVP